MITITPITPETRQAALRLELHPNQTSFIETVAQCLEEADSLELWRPVCLWQEGTLIGFAMYGYFAQEQGGRLWFDRFLIDKHYQHQGLGRQAALSVISRMRKEYPIQDIYLSVYAPNHTAISLYESLGFRFNGELDTGGEQVMVLSQNTAL